MKTQSLLLIVLSIALTSIALYMKMIPEPMVLLLVGVGFIVFIRRFKNEENHFLTHLFK